MARGRLGEGEPGCSPLCVLAQHQRRTREGLASFPSDLCFLPQKAILEAAMLGSMANRSPLSYPTLRHQSRDQDTPRWVIQMLFLLTLDASVLRKPHHGEDPGRAVKWSVAQPPAPSM